MADTPDYQSADYGGRLRTMWQFVDTLLGGSFAMQEAKTDMLPQFPAESDAAYIDRLEQSTFDGDYAATLDAIVGAVLRKPVKLSQTVPAQIVTDAEDIDLAGTHMDVFNHRLLRKGIHYGAAYVLVDMPSVPVAQRGTLDAAQSKQLNLRPYWTLYAGPQVHTRPRYVFINGKATLQQIVFREVDSVPEGAFGEVEVVRYRVWRLPVEAISNRQYVVTGPVEWELWEEQDGDADFTGKKTTKTVLVDNGQLDPRKFSRIPVAPFIANPDPDDERQNGGPTLYDLGRLCVKDYVQQSDHESNLHICSSPIPFTVNLKPAEEDSAQQAWGKTTILDCEAGGMVAYAEPAGTGLQAMERQLTKNKEQIRRMGFESLLLEGSAVATTATEQLLRAGKRASRLSQITQALKDCLELALQFSALWYGLGDDAGGEVEMGITGEELILSPADLATLRQQAVDKMLSIRTLLSVEKRGGLLADTLDEEDELTRIEEEQRRLAPPPVVPAQTPPVREMQARQ